jgi:hypothetical protein
LVREAEWYAVWPGATHDRLVIIVAHGVLVGEGLEVRHVPPLHIEEFHRLAGVVGRAAGRGRVSRGDGGLQVVQAACRIVFRHVLGVDGAIHLLIHLKELMDRIAGICIIGHRRSGDLEWAGRQRGDIGDANVWTFVVRKASAAGIVEEPVRSWQTRVTAHCGEAEVRRKLHAVNIGRRQRGVEDGLRRGEWAAPG